MTEAEKIAFTENPNFLRGKVNIGLQVLDFGRVIRGAIYRIRDHSNGDWGYDVYDFERGQWVVWDHGKEPPEGARLNLTVDSLQRAAQLLYANGVTRSAPPGFVPMADYEALKYKLEEARQKHLDDLRLLVHPKVAE